MAKCEPVYSRTGRRHERPGGRRDAGDPEHATRPATSPLATSRWPLTTSHSSPGLPDPPAGVHFIGIGGAGMSGLARVMLQRGYRVSGCDLQAGRVTAELAARGATVAMGHDEAHLDGVDLLVISAAVRADHAELVAARARRIPIMKRAALLGRLLDGRDTIAVAGTHGKTTTSALVATILLQSGLDPTAFVGGEVRGLGAGGTTSNARAGRGPWAVAEADEYDASFLQLTPRVMVITNVDADHLDYYGSMDGVRRSFATFIDRLAPGGALIVCADDAEAMRLTKRAGGRVVTYGLDRPADWAARDLTLDTQGARFTVRVGGRSIAVSTRLSGRHNAANALAALAAAAEAGVPTEQSANVLESFEPPLRRQELKGHTPRGALVLDDYAHHHAEVAATLRGLRLRYPGRRLRVAFQPHTYSRTRAFLAEIAASLCEADDVAVTDVYAARERDTLGVGGIDLVRAVRSAGACATLTPSLDDAVDWLARDDGPDVLLVTMGAGDIWQAGERLLKW